MSIYGGRAGKIAEFASQDSHLAQALDAEGRVLAAEVVLVVREEFVATLADIVFRRTMIGLRSDQGRPLYDRVASVAADELGWDETRRQQELDELAAYSDSLRV